MKLKDAIKESWLNDKVRSDKPSLTKEQKSEILGKIAEYNRYSKAIYNENDLIQIANELSEMAENAELLTISETEDQFDKITVTRNMKELKNLSSQFAKSATEAQAFKQRLTGLYEDMGVILNRYFDIQEIAEQMDNDGEIAPKDAKDIENAIKKSDKNTTSKLAKVSAIIQQGDKGKHIRPKNSDIKDIERKLTIK
jgi:hypothetical protein